MIFVSFWFSPGEDAKNELMEKKVSEKQRMASKMLHKEKNFST